MTTEFAVEAPAAAAPHPRAGSNARLAGGFIGRTWLWFIGGCLVVTLLPLLFGWRPYVVESGSMAPRIKVGDVILAAPEKDPKKLLGHVTVFHDPDAARAGTIKSHRVVTINPDGTLTTKGDANPTVDSVHLQVSQVVGLGRLLVRWVGLPLIWVQKGAWLQLGLFGASLWIGALLVMRDVDPETTDPEVDPDADGTDGPDPDGADRTDGSDEDSADPADEATSPRPRARRRFARRASHAKPAPGIGASARAFGRRAATVLAGSLALLLPTSQAAMSATTKNNSDTWSVPNYNYTTETNNLGPYLYWKLDDAAASTTAIDTSGNGRTGTYNSTWTKQIVGPLVDQAANLAVTATNAGAAGNNVSCVYTTSNTGIAATGPTVYSEIIWFKTASTTGGKLIGYENTRTGVSDSGAGGQYDRMLYMDGAGKVWFAVWKTVAAVGLAISSPTALNDGNWHMAVATMSTTTGMALYIDGVQVATNANTISETENKAGFWRVGCGNLSGWNTFWTGPNAPVAQTNYPFNGSLDEATVYTTTLTPSQITFLYWIR
jgi:signal peptidase I